MDRLPMRKLVAGSLFLMVLGLMGLVIYREWDLIISFPWQLNVAYLALTLLFHSLALGSTYIVWHLMIARIGRFRDLWTNFRFYYLSTLAKRIPSAIWYVGGRLVMYGEVGVPRSAVLNCVALEILIVGIAGALVYLAFFPLYTYGSDGVIWPVAGVAITLLGVLVIRPQILIEGTNALLVRFGRKTQLPLIHRQDILIWGGLYTLPWLFGGTALFFMVKALSPHRSPDLASAIGISTLSTLVALLSTILPGGLALKEITASALLTGWMPLSAGIVISIAYRLLQTLNEVAWALLAYQIARPHPENAEKRTAGDNNPQD